VRPVVFVSIPHGGAAGNVLRSGLMDRLLAAHPSAHIVLLSPLVKDPAFVQEFARERVHFEELPPHRPERLEGRLMALIQASYIDSGVTESVKIRRQEAVAKGTIRWIRAKRLLAGAIAPSIVHPKTRYDLIDRLASHPWADELFDKYRPSLLVTSNPGLIFSEIPLLRTAARRGVRSMAVDPSWDNFTNKLIPVRRVNRLIVWNPGRRLVTLTTTPRELYPHHDHVLRVMVEAMQSGAWREPAQILVRLHPRDELEAYAAFQGLPHVIIEKPFRETVRAGDGLSVDVTADNQRHLANTMRHSDVVVNVASTLAIEAAIFDTPVVNISFDGEAPADWVRSSRRYYRFTHYTNVTRHGAVRVAETPGALVKAIGNYLDDPSLDREGRRRMVEEQCRFLDGRAGERVAALVAAELSDVLGTPQPTSCVESPASPR
jgi:hypothetical protein